MAKKSPFIDKPSIAKCKRLVRPLISKIHGLTDLYVKYPSKFHFDMELFKSAKVDGGNLRFTHPSSANDRLASLKPFISQELYQSYSEIFAIFRTIVVTVCDVERGGKITRLSSLAALHLGKSVSLGTKSSFYKLNQAMLFETDTLPRHLLKFHSELTDDIDDWLEMEPVQVFFNHRNEILMGYVLHSLILNLRTLLYLLIPVLVHWLQEQDSPVLSRLLRTLFLEYWLFLPQSHDYRHVYSLCHELINPQDDPSLPVFWLLHRIGFWRQMIKDLRISSLVGTLGFFDNYDSMLLDSLTRSNWLRLSHITVEELYVILNRNVQNPNNTTIIISIVSEHIATFKSNLGSATSSHRTYSVLESSYSNIRKLVQTWLAFTTDGLFNSLDSGNGDIFDAIALLLAYGSKKCMHITNYLEENWTVSRVPKVNEMMHKFKFLHYHMDLMASTCVILRSYYLESEEASIDGKNISALAEFFSDMMADYSHESEMANFLLWLYGQITNDMRQLARAYFDELYVEDTWQASRALEYVHYILYK